MKMAISCTACLHCFESESLFVADRIPVINNRVYNSYIDAISCKTGSVNLVQCPRCGMVFNKSFESAQVVYDELYDNCRSNSPKYHEHLNAVVSYCSGFLTCQSTVVEIGCGNGDFLKSLSDATLCKAEGYDLAYQGEEQYGENVRFHSKYCDRSEPCDMLIIRHVLEHIPHPNKFIKDLLGLGMIKEGTHLIIEVPNFQWIIDKGTFFDITYEHCNYFFADTLTTLLNVSGFNEISTINNLFNNQYLLNHSCFVSSDNTPAIKYPASMVTTPLSTFEFTRTRLSTQIASHTTTAVWGASGKGVVFLSQLPPDVCKKIQFVVDINPAKQKKFVPLSGHKVIAPKDLQNPSDSFLVIVMNSIYLNEIICTLKTLNLNAQVISAEPDFDN